MNIHGGTIFELLLTTEAYLFFPNYSMKKWYMLTLHFSPSRVTEFQKLHQPVISVLRTSQDRSVQLALSLEGLRFLRRLPNSGGAGWLNSNVLTLAYSRAISFPWTFFSSISGDHGIIVTYLRACGLVAPGSDSESHIHGSNRPIYCVYLEMGFEKDSDVPWGHFRKCWFLLAKKLFPCPLTPDSSSPNTCPF